MKDNHITEATLEQIIQNYEPPLREDFPSELKSKLLIRSNKNLNKSVSLKDLSKSFNLKIATVILISFVSILVLPQFFDVVTNAYEECTLDMKCYYKAFFTKNDYGEDVKVTINNSKEKGLEVAPFTKKALTDYLTGMGTKLERESESSMTFVLESGNRIYCHIDKKNESWWADTKELTIPEMESYQRQVYGEIYEEMEIYKPYYIKIEDLQLTENFDEVMIEKIGGTFTVSWDGANYYTINGHYRLEWMIEENYIALYDENIQDEDPSVKITDEAFVQIIESLQSL